ncbi:MAG: DNA-directed RNA polymerase subunit beta [Dehalococcoidia bacterium]|nr:DNA-directed RNA polymerase subunit beta [Dehalococcoidia bacterium]
MVVPRHVVSEKFRVPQVIKSYSRIPDVIPLPHLVQIQVDSYQVFKGEVLRELFDEISPIQDFTGNRLEMRFTDYGFGEPKYNQEECRERDATFAAPLRVNVQLLVKETGEIKEQEIFMGDFPLMTGKGTFIINGAERVVVSQLVRSPGVYLTLERDATSGRDLCYAKLIPNRGAWLEFETSNKGVVSVKVDRKRKIPITTLIRAIDEPDILPKHPSNKEIREIQGKIEAAKTEREADKLRQQLLQHLGTNDRILSMFEDADNHPDIHYIKATLDRDPSCENKEEALLEFYRRLRPGDPPTIENAKGLITSLFFNPRRYDLGKVGRYKVNKRLGRAERTRERVLVPDDLIAIVREIVRLNNGIGKPDDIDHLGNRRVRTVGELIQNQFRIGLLRMERVIRERMTITDPQETAPSQLINIRPVVAAIKEFFGGSQLSQFMDQTNPLAELTHKRRLSALGPGGLSRDRAGFDVRDVHFSHYGRICPIETPEGPNIGLIGSLATFGRVNEYGFIETPYRRVVRELPKDSRDLIGRTVREDVKNDKEKVLAPAGTEIDEAALKKLANAAGAIAIRPFVSREVDYLSADEEENFVVAQANSPVDERGRFLADRVEARHSGAFTTSDPAHVDYLDLSPKQIVSVAASLIPFLEHDDANRALMGANMQRQAVPLIRPEIPLVGTGMEMQTAKDSGQVITAEGDGVVASVTGEAITVQYDSGIETRYPLSKFIRSNQGTCINHRAIVSRGQRLTRDETLADSSSTDAGELALGQTLLCAFMSWEGYNFEDAIIISQKVSQDDKFTSIHVEKHEVEARDTKLGPEEITRDIPNVGEESLLDLDEYGIIRVGAEVQSGDILVGKITPKGETELTAEEKLLRAIFGEKAREVKDTSLRVPHGERGKVIETRFFARPDNDPNRPAHGTANHNCRWPYYAQITDEMAAGVQAMVRISIAQRRKLAEGDKMAGRHGNKGVISRILPVEDMPHLEDGTPVDIILNPLGVPSRMNIGQVLETHLGWAARRMGFRAISPVFDGGNPKTIEDALCRLWICEQAGALTLDHRTNGSGGNGAGGNGATNAIGENVDAEKVSKWLKSRGYDAARVFDDLPENVGEATRVGVELWLEQPEIKAWLLEHEGVKRIKGRAQHELDMMAERVLLNTGWTAPIYGKQVLYDGRSGDRFDQAVTVGYIYMLKLVHLVEDKIHARSTGPYSLITQQPLGGKAQFGGQRFGEMEVWALEAYGAAHILQELLTVKSDDVVGRVKTYEAIVKGEDIQEPGVPESFKVLVKELQSLGLAVEVLNEEEERVTLAETSMQDLPELGIDLSGFEKGEDLVGPGS